MSNIYKQPGFGTTAAIGVISVIITLGLLALSWYMILPDIETNAQQATTLENEVKDLQDKLSEIDEAENLIAQISSSVDKVEMSLPENEKVPELLVSVSSMAWAAGITELSDISLGSNVESEETNYYAAGFTLSGKALYADLITLLNNLFNNVRTININSINITPAETETEGEVVEPGLITFTIIGSTYSQPEEISTTSATETSEVE